MKKEVPKVYDFVLSNRDYLSFLSGIVVSGYAVGISLNSNNNIWHWITVALGTVVGLALYGLTMISKKYELQIFANAKNKSDIDDAENRNSTWETLNNKSYKSTRILNMLPEHAVPALILISIISLVMGIISLNIGNSQRQQIDSIEKQREHAELLNGIDSGMIESNAKIAVEIKRLNDSITSLKNAMNLRENIISHKNKITFKPNRVH